MTIMLGFLVGLALAIFAVGCFYARGCYQWHLITFRGRRWVQPASCGQSTSWNSGIAVRLFRGRHLVVTRR